MQGGKINVKQKTRRITQLSGVLLPLGLALYGLLFKPNIDFGIDKNYILALVMIPWVLIGVEQFLRPEKNYRGLIIRFAAYHICAGAYGVFISGLSTPFVTVGWVLLLLISYTYLSGIGLIINFTTLIAAFLADIALHSYRADIVSLDFVAIASIFIIGIVVVIINRIQQDDSEELERSRVKESIQRVQIDTLINNLADAVISLDKDGMVEIYNAACLNLLNTNAKLSGKFINDVIEVFDESSRKVDLFRVIKRARGMQILDNLSMDSDEERVRLEISSSSIRSGYSKSTDGYVLILRDVTKAKSLEEERDEFISVVSHELRTPITIAEGTISNVRLMADRGNVPKAALSKSLADAHDQILFLARMVNDLSTLSRAERGVADDPEIIDVRELISNLYKEYSPEAAKKNLTFNIDMVGKLGSVHVSRLYLRELLQNFITNAIKYTKEGSVTVRAESDGKLIRFEVKDTGIGISKTDLAKIFEKFYRSEDYRTRETGGTGLGLYVAAKLSRKLRTKIEVKSRLNNGATFSFSLPIEKNKQTNQ